MQLHEIMVSFVYDIVWKLETWNSTLFPNVIHDRRTWKITLITWGKLLLHKLSFTEVNSSELTLLFYICASCIMYSSNTSLPGFVQISLMFAQRYRGRRCMARRTDTSFSTCLMLGDSLFACSCRWKDNALMQPEPRLRSWQRWSLILDGKVGCHHAGCWNRYL